MKHFGLLVLKSWRLLVGRPMSCWRRNVLRMQGVSFGRGLNVEQGVQVCGTGSVRMGDVVWLGRGVFIQVWPGAELAIGDKVHRVG